MHGVKVKYFYKFLLLDMQDNVRLLKVCKL
jgi:hypothetical protein